MNLGPRLDQSLLRAGQRASDALNWIEGECCRRALVGGVEVRPVMRRAQFREHPNDDAEEARELRHPTIVACRRRSSVGLTAKLSGGPEGRPLERIVGRRLMPYSLPAATFRSAMILSFCEDALPPWNVTIRRTPLPLMTYAFAIASYVLGFVVNTAPSPMPGISDASGPPCFASTTTLCLISLGLRPRGQTFDARDFSKTLFAPGTSVERPAAPGAAERGGVVLSAEVDTVIGFFDTSAKGLRLGMTMDAGQLAAFEAQTTVGGKTLALRLRKEAGKPRTLLVESADAGQAFKLIGFYPNMAGGHANLEINLDSAATSTSGTLWVRNFAILGDPVVTEVLQSADDGRPPIGGSSGGSSQRVVRERVEFDRMRVPFSMSQGQLVLEHSYVQGMLIGATLKGRVDFKSQRMALAGTYVPLHALNSALGQIPVLGQILTGTRGEGLVGINFAIQGSMARPEVIVHPLSAVAPGIFREMFQIGPQGTEVAPRAAPRPAKPAPADPARSSSTPPASQRTGKGQVEPEVGGSWAVEAKDSKGQKR